MCKNEKEIDIKSLYSHELQEIRYILQNLENGRVYELSNIQSDGYLNTNIIKLKKKLNFLLNEIQYGKTTSLDEMDELFK